MNQEPKLHPAFKYVAQRIAEGPEQGFYSDAWLAAELETDTEHKFFSLRVCQVDAELLNVYRKCLLRVKHPQDGPASAGSL